MAALWLGLCLAVLVFGYVQRGIHDMPVGFTWLMIFLSAPLGLLIPFIAGKVAPILLAQTWYVYDPFWDLVPYWIGFVFSGYVQWFILIPAAFRKVFRTKAFNSAVNPDSPSASRLP